MSPSSLACALLPLIYVGLCGAKDRRLYQKYGCVSSRCSLNTLCIRDLLLSIVLLWRLANVSSRAGDFVSSLLRVESIRFKLSIFRVRLLQNNTYVSWDKALGRRRMRQFVGVTIEPSLEYHSHTFYLQDITDVITKWRRIVSSNLKPCTTIGACNSTLLERSTCSIVL